MDSLSLFFLSLFLFLFISYSYHVKWFIEAALCGLKNGEISQSKLGLPHSCEILKKISGYILLATFSLKKILGDTDEYPALLHDIYIYR